jgi:hypothetical protein
LSCLDYQKKKKILDKKTAIKKLSLHQILKMKKKLLSKRSHIMTKTLRSTKVACIAIALALILVLVACSNQGTSPLDRDGMKNKKTASAPAVQTCFEARGHHCLVQHPTVAHFLVCTHCEWITGVAPQVPGEASVYGCGCVVVEIITVAATCLLDGYTIEHHYKGDDLVWIGNQKVTEVARGHHCLVPHATDVNLLICVHCGWGTGVPPQVPGETSVYGCPCDECNDAPIEFSTVGPVSIGFIGYYLHASRPNDPMSTSIYWQTLNPGELIDWVAVNAAYDAWVTNGGLAPLRETWKTSGHASFTFADNAEIGHADFTPDQLESYYQAFFVSGGYILPATEPTLPLPTIAAVKKDLVITGINLLSQSNGQRWYRVTINGTRVLNYNNETSSSNNRLTISDKGLQSGLYVVEIFGNNPKQTVVFDLVYANKTVVSVDVLSYTID